MKIKTKLHLIITTVAILFAGVAAISLLWQKQTAKHLEDQALFEELNQAIFGRARLREEYFLYREDRSKEQFLLIHKQIGGVLERMSGTFTGLEEKASLIKMMGFHTKIEGFFNQLVRLDENATVHTATTQALRERIISLMLVNADSMYREGLRLRNAADEKTVRQNNVAHLYSNIVFGLLALFIVSLAGIIIRSVTSPLTRLHKGTEIIAEGNLDYKTNIRTPDEIGQLSNAFDAMTENLQKITTSREELSKEIVERKRAEEALRQATDRLMLAARAGGVGIWDYDVVNNSLTWDDQMFRLFGITQDQFVSAYAAWQAGLHPEDRQRGNEETQLALRGEKEFNTEFRVIHLDGTIRNIRSLALVQRDGSGKPLHLIGTNWDITAQKQADEAMRDSLTEKEVLLREVHHRVKNNLSAIIGLIGMGQTEVKDAATATLMKELESRIRAMLLIHEGLYRSENLARIAFQGYLETLLSHLHSSFASQGGIRFSVAAADVELGLDAAVPCGLIVNEWVTNAFKHAFPGGQPRPGEKECEITVSAERNGGATTLTVADNGVGLPADLDWAATKTLGLRLVQMLGQHQLGGTIEVDRSRGTRFTLTFNART